jgi:hypothetical protein
MNSVHTRWALRLSRLQTLWAVIQTSLHAMEAGPNEAAVLYERGGECQEHEEHECQLANYVDCAQLVRREEAAHHCREDPSE